MIASEPELRQTQEQLLQLQEALAELRNEVYTRNPERFRLMAESYIAEINMLRTRIDEYLGIRHALEAASDITIRISSASFAEGAAPTTVVSRTITALQRGLQRVGEFLARTRNTGTEGFSRASLARHFEFDVIAVVPGSFEVALKVSSPQSGAVPYEIAADALEKLGALIRQTGQVEIVPEQLRRIIPDLNFQLQVLQSLRELAPLQRRREYIVELGGSILRDERVVFTRRTRKQLADLIRTEVQDAVEEGIVREINLDRRTFIMKTQATTLRCRYQAPLEDQIKRLLDTRVSVHGRAVIAPDGSINYMTVREVRPVASESSGTATTR